jgi:hypothetical protein
MSGDVRANTARIGVRKGGWRGEAQVAEGSQRLMPTRIVPVGGGGVTEKTPLQLKEIGVYAS